MRSSIIRKMRQRTFVWTSGTAAARSRASSAFMWCLLSTVFRLVVVTPNASAAGADPGGFDRCFVVLLGALGSRVMTLRLAFLLPDGDRVGCRVGRRPENRSSEVVGSL